MSIAVAFVCKENLALSNNYTSKCKKNINFWSEKFDVFVLTNNIDEFKNYNCKCFFDDSYYSTFNRFDILNELQKEYEIVIYLDCDEHFFIEDLMLNDLPYGIHSHGKWVDTWGNIKNLDYFKIWRQHILVDDDVYFPWESVFVLKSNNLWESTYAEILKYKPISRETEKQAMIDENPHHGIERCEAIALYVACQNTNFPLHLNSEYATQFWQKR
jgi:hypothetical protein